MADEQNQGNAAAKPDPIAELKATNDQLLQALNNFKQEVNRKIDGLRPTPPKQEAAPKKSFKDLLWENEEEAADLIKKSAVDEAVTIVRKENAEQQKSARVAQQLYNEFPELNSQTDPLTKRANEIYQGMSEDERNDPRAMRLAVSEAALDLGVKPMSKRQKEQSDEDGFLLGGGRSDGDGRSRRRKEPELSQETLETAQLMGLNVEDPKVLERLKQHAGRKEWTKYK
jgi:hypothetical protein